MKRVVLLPLFLLAGLFACKQNSSVEPTQITIAEPDGSPLLVKHHDRSFLYKYQIRKPGILLYSNGDLAQLNIVGKSSSDQDFANFSYLVNGKHVYDFNRVNDSICYFLMVNHGFANRKADSVLLRANVFNGIIEPVNLSSLPMNLSYNDVTKKPSHFYNLMLTPNLGGNDSILLFSLRQYDGAVGSEAFMENYKNGKRTVAYNIEKDRFFIHHYDFPLKVKPGLVYDDQFRTPAMTMLNNDSVAVSYPFTDSVLIHHYKDSVITPENSRWLYCGSLLAINKGLKLNKQDIFASNMPNYDQQLYKRLIFDPFNNTLYRTIALPLRSSGLEVFKNSTNFLYTLTSVNLHSGKRKEILLPNTAASNFYIIDKKLYAYDNIRSNDTLSVLQPIKSGQKTLSIHTYLASLIEIGKRKQKREQVSFEFILEHIHTKFLKDTIYVIDADNNCGGCTQDLMDYLKPKYQNPDYTLIVIHNELDDYGAFMKSFDAFVVIKDTKFLKRSLLLNPPDAVYPLKFVLDEQSKVTELDTLTPGYFSNKPAKNNINDIMQNISKPRELKSSAEK